MAFTVNIAVEPTATVWLAGALRIEGATVFVSVLPVRSR